MSKLPSIREVVELCERYLTAETRLMIDEEKLITALEVREEALIKELAQVDALSGGNP